MERDIRDLFKNDDTGKKKLPSSHREEFLEKLKRSSKKQKKFYNNWKVVASIVILFSVGFYFINSNETKQKTPTLLVQVKKIEKEYLININKEWENFIEVTQDSILVNKYKIKMQDFDKDYQKITKQLEKNPNNINVLEALISNLQRRLELIKNIKEHIKELNQKNTNNETIFI